MLLIKSLKANQTLANELFQGANERRAIVQSEQSPVQVHSSLQTTCAVPWYLRYLRFSSRKRKTEAIVSECHAILCVRACVRAVPCSGHCMSSARFVWSYLHIVHIQALRILSMRQVPCILHEFP